MDIRERNSIRSVRESELLIIPLGSRGQHNLGRGKGQCFHRVSEEEKEGDCREAVNSRVVRDLQRELYQKAKQKMRKPLEEDDRKAVFGKTERTV